MPSTDHSPSAAQWSQQIAAAYPHNVLSPGAYLPGELAPFPTELNDLDQDVAYAIAYETIRRVSKHAGAQLRGYKISVASAHDQASINATEPVLGIFTDAQILTSGAVIDLAAANAPLLEPEVAMRTTVELWSDASIEQIAASVEVTAAIEVPTSRFSGWLPAEGPGVIGVSGLTAENAVAGCVVVGEQWIPGPSPEQMRELSVRLTGPGELRIDGEALNVIDGPYAAMQWLVRKLDALARGPMPAGTIVSSGTLTPPSRVVAGTYTADFDSGLGTASVTFN